MQPDSSTIFVKDELYFFPKRWTIFVNQSHVLSQTDLRHKQIIIYRSENSSLNIYSYMNSDNNRRKWENFEYKL